MKFIHLTERKDIVDLIEWHNKRSEFCVLDFETTSKDPRTALLVDIQMSGRKPDEAVMFSGEFLPLLEKLTCTQVFQNFKYDWKVALRHGVDFRGKPMRDTMLLAHLDNENTSSGLDSMVQAEYGDDYKERFWARFKNYQDAPFEQQLEYAAKDIIYTGHIYRKLLASLKTQGVPDSLIEHVHRLALALFDTEVQGIRVDLDYTMHMGTQLKQDILGLESSLRTMGGDYCESVEMDLWLKELEKRKTEKGRANVPKPEFNFTSSGQVATLLYDELGLPEVVDKKTRRRTVDDKALEKLEHRHPLIPKIRDLRKFSKMYGSFIEGVLDKVTDGVIYPSFNVNGTVTGRLSHSEPNMAQMPSKGEWAKIRGIFIPAPGHKVITCDYGQLEVCIAAHFSMDKNLLKIIHEGASQHDITAAGLQCDRNKAKTTNFSMQYGCTEYKIAEIHGCSVPRAKEIIEMYWETYKELGDFVRWCHSQIEEGKPIANPFGRLRRFPTQFANHWEKEAAKRQVFSSLIQGTGADITSRAFYLVSERMMQEGWGRTWFTVHDELLVEAKEQHVEKVRQALIETMVGVGQEISLKIPLTVDCSPGLDRWQK